jgi:DNA-binding IclR family transcriptional regulator
MSTERRGIGSVEVGGQLLRVLTEAEGPMMLRDLAASAGMTAAKAHPYMVSYMRLGLVEQDRSSGRYELGPLALQMGLATMRRLNTVRIATEAISELVMRVNQTIALSVWGNHGPTVVRIEEGTGAVHVNMRVGSIMSLLGTATGRVFAAFLPPKIIDTFIESGVGRASVGDEAERKITRSQVDKVVADVKGKGLARAVERPIPGVNALSAPVFDHSGSIALVITAIGPAHTFDADWDGAIAVELRKCAATVSTRLGFAAKGSRAA